VPFVDPPDLQLSTILSTPEPSSSVTSTIALPSDGHEAC
jgi:hypothetical protein